MKHFTLTNNNDIQLLTNMQNHNKKTMETTIRLYRGSNKVVIEDSAFNRDGKLLDSHFGVYTLTPNKDHTDFWKLYDICCKQTDTPIYAYIPWLDTTLEIETIDIKRKVVHFTTKEFYSLENLILLKNNQ